jgi:site-specific DNA-methyltransferase (adenine-specific)
VVIDVVREENVEKLFDVLDQSASLYYELLKVPYLDGLVKTCENILANGVETELDELNIKLTELIKSLEGIDFDKEEIRKAFQYSCLRGLKHQGISNQMITPESIGIFFSYLVNKLYEVNNISILDPLVGSGNLLAGLANNLDQDTVIFGIDNNYDYYKLSQALMGMLDYQENIFYQDILSFENLEVDLITTDFSGIDQNEIFDIIKHLNGLLKDNCFMISVIDNSFFDNDLIKDFIYEVKEKWHFFGMIVLPESLFKVSRKSIFILQKIGDNFVKPDKFLVADLPDFNDEEKMITVINQLNDWFNKIKFLRVRENNEKNNGS